MKQRHTRYKLGFISEEELAAMQQHGVPTINLGDFDIDQDVIDMIPPDVAARYRCIPINRVGASLIVATCDPSDRGAIMAIASFVACNVEVLFAPEEAIREALARYYDVR